MSERLKKQLKSVLSVLLLTAFIMGLQWLISKDFGVKQENIEAHFKEHEMIVSLPVVTSVSEDAAGCIAWGENTDYSFHFGLYFKDGIFGYVQKIGGNINTSPDKVKKYMSPKNDCSVYMSVNENHVAKMKVYFPKAEPKIYDINPNEPFVYASPKGVHRVEFFDINGEKVKITRIVIN